MIHARSVLYVHPLAHGVVGSYVFLLFHHLLLCVCLHSDNNSPEARSPIYLVSINITNLVGDYPSVNCPYLFGLC